MITKPVGNQPIGDSIMDGTDAGGRGRLTGWLGWVVVGALGLLVAVLAGPATSQDTCTSRHCPNPLYELEHRFNLLEESHGALESTVATLAAENDELRDDLAALTAQVAALQTDVDAVEQKVAPITHDAAGGRLLVSGVNLQIVNGTGTTFGAPNGRGNLIVGYNAPRPAGTPAQRTGSHNIVVGDHHEWTHWGGLVAGIHNSILNEWTTVTGGRDNIASGEDSTVSGGYTNHASGRQAAVSGGHLNQAAGFQASVSGGLENRASSLRASVSGGEGNLANGAVSSVSGGQGNTASGGHSSILGGFNNTITSIYGLHPN